MSSLSKFAISQIIVIFMLVLILYVFFPVAGALDRHIIENWMTSQGEFYLREHWALATLGHEYVKWILIFCMLLVLLRWILSFNFKHSKTKLNKNNESKSNESKTKEIKTKHSKTKQSQFKQNSENQWRSGYFFLMLLLPIILISVLKAHSVHACPWNMTLSVQDHFTWILNATAGHCFPGGHASAGFSILAGYFVYRDRDTKLAHFYLIAGIVLGFAMGWAQMMRGAHFLSHNLWTGVIIWTVNVVSYLIFYSKLNPKRSS